MFAAVFWRLIGGPDVPLPQKASGENGCRQVSSTRRAVYTAQRDMRIIKLSCLELAVEHFPS